MRQVVIQLHKHDNSEFITDCMPPQDSHYMHEDHYIGSKVAPNDIRQKDYEYASVFRDTKLHVQKTLSQAIAFANEYEAFLGLVDKIVKPRENIDAHNIQTLQALTMLTEGVQQNPESKILGQISQMIDNKFKEYINENRTVDASRKRIGSYNEPNRNEGQDVVNEATTLDQRVNTIFCQEPLRRKEVDTCINFESTPPIVHLNQLSGSYLYIKAEINSTPCKLLVDIGSPVCVVSSKLYNTMEVDKTELQKTDTALYTADGTKHVVKGQVNVQVKLGTEIFKQNVIVANIEELAGILGMDYLETQDVEIQIGKRVLKIKGKNVQLEKSKSNICARVKLSNDITIPVHSEMLIESHIAWRPEGAMGLIEVQTC
ncbi:PNPLA8 [Mytilus coruscus]|uniref:PNPLA8 n=1 Tax=Mytilus coruscus TaxID=42192 RepID=A0A6J8BV71_MYTCO|nr:PNPLA8 [Mytilus coruscus]